jgi:F-type H+-transporting ATPase subunit alpha
MFASDLDAASRQQLTRGARLMELLKQGQYSPFPVENQVVSIWAGTNGHLDEVPVEDINRFETEFLEHLKHKSSILTTLAQTNVMDDDTAEALKTAIVDFKKGFFGEGDNHLVGAGHEEHDAISGADVDQEKNRQAEALVSLAGTAGTRQGSGSPGHRDLRKG